MNALNKITLVVLAGLFSFSIRAQVKHQTNLWKVEGENIKTSYVFGTIHILPKEDFVIKDKVKKAFETTDKIALELDMADPGFMKEIMAHSYLKKGDELKKYMDEDEYKLLDNYLKEKIGTGMVMYNNTKPFMLMSVILTAGSGKPMASYELSFLTMARQANKEMEGLESYESQVAIFDSEPYDEQIDDLIEMIKNPEQNQDLYNNMVSFYLNEDVEGLYDLMDDYMDGDIEMTEKMLDERNKKWIPEIAKFSKENSVFYAVGAGHLGGKNGVLNLLKKAGYKVTPVLD